MAFQEQPEIRGCGGAAGHSKPVTCVAWSCNGDHLASGSNDRTLRVWLLDQGGSSVRQLHSINYGVAVEQVCWHPSVPTRYATISGEKELRLWDARSSRSTGAVNVGGENINLAWSPDGRYLAVGNRDDCITVVDVSKNKALRKTKFNYEVNELAWSPNSQFLFMTTGVAEPGGTVQVQRHVRGEILRHEATLAAHTSNCFSVRVHAGARRMAVGSADTLLSVWDLEEMYCMHCISRFDTPVKSLCFSGDGGHLAVTTDDSPDVHVCDTETGDLVLQVSTGTPTINAVAWHPSRPLLAVGLEKPSMRYSRALDDADFLLLASL